MHHIHAGQIKAARAMLDWGQNDLAAATGLSLNTIRNLEAGNISPRSATNSIIRQVIEGRGLEFIDHEGVRRRPTDVLFYRGHDSRELFYDDLLQTIKQQGRDVLAVFTSTETFLYSIGANEKNLNRLEQLCAVSKIKCLLSERRAPSFIVPTIQFRAVSKLQVCPSAYFVYGDKVGFVMRDCSELRFIIIQSTSTARHWAGHFVELWEEAIPFQMHAQK